MNRKLKTIESVKKIWVQMYLVKMEDVVGMEGMCNMSALGKILSFFAEKYSHKFIISIHKNPFYQLSMYKIIEYFS